MFNGAHVVLYSTDADADRAFLRDAFEMPFVDVGHGWLIFELPPTELAVHPTEGPNKHEMYLMCEDVEVFVAKMQGKGVACTEITEQSWGRLTAVTLPGGSELGVYQPHHERPG